MDKTVEDIQNNFIDTIGEITEQFVFSDDFNQFKNPT